MNKKLQSKEDFFIQFTDEELAELKIEKGDKFSVELLDDQSIKLTPFAKMELDLNEFPRDLLEFLIKESCEKDISINEVISDSLKKAMEKYE